MKGLGSHMPIEKRRFIHSFLFPAFYLLLISSVKLIEELEGLSFVKFGVRPMKQEGILGIVTSPLIHGDWDHLYSNSVSLFVLGVALFYFYHKIAYKIFFLIYLLSGIGTWLVARDSWHIGASSLVYGLVSFLVVSGVIRKYVPLIAISFIVILFYGSLVWGLFPLKIDLPYSWEGHFWGAIAGVLVAVLYRNDGPQKPKVLFNEDAEEDGDEDAYWMNTNIEP